MQMEFAIDQVRRSLADPPRTLNVNTVTDGMTMFFDLPAHNVDADTIIVQYVLSGSGIVGLIPASQYVPWSSTVTYSAGQTVLFNGNYFHALEASTDDTPPATSTANTWWTPDIAYTLDDINGTLTTTSPIPNNATFQALGQFYRLFGQWDIAQFVHQATYQHCQGQTETERYKDAMGFITYRDQAKDLHNLPRWEEQLLTTLAAIQAFWVLASDAATDVGVQTSEGTSIDRTARYNQLMKHISALQEWYEQQCAEWNVGMKRIEMSTLRRVSRTTGRLVPIFRDREFDDHRYPVRELPQIDRRDEDSSGVPSPIWNGAPWF